MDRHLERTGTLTKPRPSGTKPGAQPLEEGEGPQDKLILDRALTDFARRDQAYRDSLKRP